MAIYATAFMFEPHGGFPIPIVQGTPPVITPQVFMTATDGSGSPPVQISLAFGLVPVSSAPPGTSNATLLIPLGTSPKKADQMIRQGLSDLLQIFNGWIIDPNDIYIPFAAG